jgi:hypothetical protein
MTSVAEGLLKPPPYRIAKDLETPQATWPIVWRDVERRGVNLREIIAVADLANRFTYWIASVYPLPAGYAYNHQPLDWKPAEPVTIFREKLTRD